ncbi:MAG: ATP-dependent helicase [Bacteroidetes bacterium]|nr:ATP-dependent helicase [Bacteroidota bacterium]
MKYTVEQIDAINTISKNLLIIACAGSGKTQVISERIINILKQGTPPSKVIAFTYTEKAAGELQARILKLCREQLPDLKGLAEMYIGTIHAWCLNVLQDYKYEFQKFSVLDEIKLKLFVERKFSTIGMKALDMERFKDTGHFIQLMGILREADFHNREDVPANLFTALEQYEKTLQQSCYLDFTMIMTKAFHYIKNDNAFRNKILSNIGYLIVDEYQDVNPIQEALVRELYELGANTCVVGDDDQTIFQWRGSDIDYIQHFKDRYENVKEVILNDNFRSSKAIVDVALKVITNNTVRLPKQMVAKGFQTYEKGDILYNQFTTVEEENENIVNSIRNLRGTLFQDKPELEHRGLDYSDFVILVRKWKKADAIIEALQAAQIPFIVSGVNNLFQRHEVGASKAIFMYLNAQLDKETLKHHWLSLSDNITEEKLNDAIAFLDKNKPNKNTYYERFNIQVIFQTFLDKAGIREDLFSDEAAEVTGFSNEEIIFYNLGMFSQIINDFETIYFTYPPDRKLSTFLSFLIYSAGDYYPEGWQNNTYKTPNAVQIMTIYQAKGLEFPVVFIPGLNKNYLPSKQPSGKQVWHFIERTLIRGVERYFPRPEDERRLMYVAITRAKKFLLMSRAPDGRQQGNESIFGNEVRASDYVIISPNRNYSEREHGTPKPFLDLSNISLTFSLLKSFFDCPYSFKFYTFYGFQTPLGARMGYGSAIHNTLMELHREYLDGNQITKAELETLLNRHTNFPYATEKITADMTTKADTAVNIYYDKNSPEFNQIEFAEKQIQLDLGDGILVSGKMDLIKKKNFDGTFEKTIVDFKSTEDSQAYNATIDQLQLYALGYRALTGENADFLQIYNLDTNEGYKNELTANDLEGIKNKIILAANDIRNNNLEHTCNNPECVCRFKKSN